MGINHSKLSKELQENDEFYGDDEFHSTKVEVDPFDVDDRFQEKLLANMIYDESFLDAVGDVMKPSYFNKEEFQFICKTIVDYYRDHLKTVTDTVLLLATKTAFGDPSLEQSKRKVLLLIMKLFDLNEVAEYLRDTEQVQAYSVTFMKQQEMKLAIIKSAELIPKGDFKTIFTLIESASSVGVSKSLGTDLDDVQERERNKPRIDVRPLPWASVNRRTKGGLGKTEMMAIIAGMGSGKTMIAANLMAHAKRTGQNAVLYSLEMHEAYNRHRIDAILLGETIDDLNTDNPETRERLRDTLDALPPSKTYIKHFDGAEVTVQTLKTHIKQIKARGIHLDLVVIDYLDIMEPLDPHQKSKKDWEKFEVITREVSSLAKQEKVAIVALLQTNTDGISSEVITSKSTSGGAKRLHACDLIFGYGRPDHFKVLEKATWSFIKNRFGRDGFVLDVDTAYAKGFINVKDSEFNASSEAKEQAESTIKRRANTFLSSKRGNDTTKPKSEDDILGSSLDDPFEPDPPKQ